MNPMYIPQVPSMCCPSTTLARASVGERGRGRSLQPTDTGSPGSTNDFHCGRVRYEDCFDLISALGSHLSVLPPHMIWVLPTNSESVNHWCQSELTLLV